MRLIKLHRGKYTVAAPVNAGKLSDVQRFLLTAAPDMQASAQGMYALFERYASDGRRLLTTANFHEANKTEAIWEFIKGRLRVYCFIDSSDQLIILSHGTVKKGQKVATHHVEQAIRLKKDYLKAKGLGAIDWAESSTKEDRHE